jgi:hypothetical protein
LPEYSYEYQIDTDGWFAGCNLPCRRSGPSDGLGDLANGCRVDLDRNLDRGVMARVIFAHGVDMSGMVLLGKD